MVIGPDQSEMRIPPDASANVAACAEEHELQTQDTWRDTLFRREDQPTACTTPVAAERALPVDEPCPVQTILPVTDAAVADFEYLILCSRLSSRPAELAAIPFFDWPRTERGDLGLARVVSLTYRSWAAHRPGFLLNTSLRHGIPSSRGTRSR